MQLKTNLRTILKSILSKNQKTKDIAQDDDMMDQLVSTTSVSQNFNAFTQFLEDDCGLKLQTIVDILNKLLSISQTKECLGQQLLRQWLVFKIFEAMDILKQKSDLKKKRSQVNIAFNKFIFKGNQIKNLLKECWNAANLQLDDNQLNDLIDFIYQENKIEVRKLFQKDKLTQMQIERLINLIQDYKIMPEKSFNKQLQRELILSHLQKYPQGKQILKKSGVGFMTLQNQIPKLRESYLQYQSFIPSQVQDIFKKIIQSNSDEKIYQNLSSLKSKLCSIDVPQLIRLINKTKKSEELIENKDVILFIGNTGSGKSTTILKFLDYKLKIGTFRGLSTLVPVGQLKKQHISFYTSPQAKSCTRYINAVPIPDSMYPKGTSEKKKNLVLCDSPGFGDTAGVQVDIANGVGMINALRKAKSVKIIVIIPYESLIADRMVGAIKISEIISNLFSQLTVIKSIAILFNKTPPQKIAQTSKLINNKLQHLNENQKSNQKLYFFLKEIFKRSLDKQNFIDPFDTDFKIKFQQIRLMPQITQMSQFQYQFSDATKKDIQNFLLGQKNKIKDYCDKEQFQHSYFHFKNLRQLKNILNKSAKLQQGYMQTVKHIIQASKKLFDSYQYQINQIISRQQKKQGENSLIKIIYQKLQQIYGYFKQFDDMIPSLISIDQIHQMVETKKHQLLSRFDNINDVTIETIIAVKAFSEELSPKFQVKISQKLEKNIKQVFFIVKEQIKHKTYSQMNQVLVKLRHLSNLIVKLGISKLDVQRQMNKLKESLIKDISDGFIQIAKVQRQQSLRQSDIRDANIRVSQIQQILKLKFLEKNNQYQKELVMMVSKIQSKCKKRIRELQNLNALQYLPENTSMNKNQLKKKLNYIQLLMKVGNLKEKLKDQYLQAKSSVEIKLQQNKEIVKNFISALKGNNIEQLDKNLGNIKKARNYVIQCSLILGNEEKSVDLANSIQEQFIQYLRKQILALKSIDLKIGQISQQKFSKIENYYQKIENYAKMASIGNKIKEVAQQFSDQYFSKLKKPFKEFLQKDVSSLKQDNEYQSLFFILQKLQKFCIYAIKMQQILDAQAYRKVSQDQPSIVEILKKKYGQMKKEIEKFMSFKLSQPQPVYLKQLLTILLSHNSNSSFDNYLGSKLNFEVNANLNMIETNLFEIKDTVKDSLDNYKVDFCKFYVEIQDMYKFKKGISQKFGFRNIQKEIQSQFIQNIKEEELRIVEIITGNNKPSRIPFNELKIYYDSYKQLPKGESEKKRRLITSELGKIQHKIFQKLKQYKNELEDPTFIYNRSKLYEFLQCFYEAIELQKQLKMLYTQQSDKKLIIVNQSTFIQIKSKIHSVYSAELLSLTQILEEYSLDSVSDKLKVFGQLQNIIFQLFSLDKVKFEDLSQTQKTEEERELIIFIRNKGNQLKGQINSHPFSKQQQKAHSKSFKKLKPLIQLLKKAIQYEIKLKYEGSADNFCINEDFKKYYWQVQKNEQKKQNIENNIQTYFKNLFNDYIQKWNQSSDQAENLIKNIQNGIKFLPSKLQQHYNSQFYKLKQNFQISYIQDIKKTSQQILKHEKNSSNVAILFEKAIIAKEHKKNAFYKEWLDSFKKIYTKYEQKISKVQQTINYIQVHLMKIIQQKQKYPILVQFFEILQKKLFDWLKKIVITGQSNIQTLKVFFDNPIKKKQEELVSHYQLVKQIMLVYNFIDRIQNIQLIEDKNLIIQANKSYGDKLSQIIDIYSKKIQNKPECKLTSQQILDLQKMTKFQRQIRQLKLKGKIINKIQQQLQKNHPLLIKLNNIPEQMQVFKFYDAQLQRMIRFVKDYEFFGDMKRNMTKNQLQQDINSLHKYCEILEARQGFFNSQILLNSSDKYVFSKIANQIRDKFNQHVQHSKQQVKETFIKINGTSLERTNLLINQLKIIKDKQKQTKFTLAEKNKTLEEIDKLIHKQFEDIKKKSLTSFEQLKNNFKNKQKEINKLNDKMDEEKRKQQGQDLVKLNIKITQESTKRMTIIEKAAKEEQKTNQKNKLNSQVQGFKKDFQDQLIKNKIKIQQKYQNQINALKQDQIQSAKKFSENVIIFQKALIDISSQASKYQKSFEIIFQQNQQISNQLLQIIQNSLSSNKQDERSLGKHILITYKIFANYATKRITKLIKGQDIKYVLENLQKICLKGREKINKDVSKNIQKLFNIFSNKYQLFKKRYKDSPKQTTIDYMIGPLKDLGNMIKDQFYQSKKPKKDSQIKIELLARIFSLWAILKSKICQGVVEFTVQLHPTQLTALILLLGIQNPQQNISNRLAQIGTGEGKSIVLAGLSCYLALVGFNVRCACYSLYLSERDSQSFKQLFQKLGVQNNIKYGTFNQLCEDILNTGGKDLKQQVQSMILAPPSKLKQKIASFFAFNITSFQTQNKIRTNPTILVIDQVDIFFEQNFFGNTYCPAITLTDKAIGDLLKYIWNQVQKKSFLTDPQQIIKSNQFKNAVKKYPTIQKLLENQVNGMITGALNYKHDYLIIDKKIVYKDGDSISSRINYGYKTTFANLYQFNKQRVSSSNLDESLQISLMIAEFSYALLPKYFSNILGVTGTLQVLPYYKKMQLQERYAISDQYAIPSPFGNNNRRIENYQIATQESIYKQIIQKIEQVKNSRPILIFFKEINELNEFANHPDYFRFLKRNNILTEQHQPETRQSRIIRAVNKDNITLMSSAFGRGTDFMILDDKINQDGGLHVIQAFLSLQQSEEIQVKGRTARQNSPGSYNCIINQNCLEQLNIKVGQIPKNAQSSVIHQKLLKARETRSDCLSQSTIKMLQDANKKHQNVMKIFEQKNLSQTNLITYVSKLNQYPVIKKKVIKTILAVDATGSMSSALRKTCEIIGNTFQRTFEVLKDKKVQSTIQIKIKLYRNYNSPYDQILEGTAFENMPHNLKMFLSKVEPKGGWGNEALQVLVQSLNKQDKIDQVILIGDAAPNTIQDIKRKRLNKGQQYWQKNGYFSTNIGNQMQKFIVKHKGCPIHSFYLNNGEGFKEISKQTTGEAQPFDIYCSNVTQRLQAFVIENILKTIEKKEGNIKNNLVDTYRKMFVDKKK